MKQQIRQAAVAGSFYPADAHELRDMVQSYLSQSSPQSGAAPKAIIAPHAGYIYSGSVAASAYINLQAISNKINKVVLLGPSHRVPLRGIATSSATHFSTPLGLVPVDQDSVNSVNELIEVQSNDEAHAMEHSLEVHLPFLQQVLGEFSLIPMVVGQATPEEVDRVLSLLWDGPETLFVISSDLSHYHDYETAKKLDRETSQSIESLDYRNIQYENACGRDPVNGLLHLAKRFGLHAVNVDLRNSGDTAGAHDKVVGYGAYLFH